jgi:hypothetical protein
MYSYAVLVVRHKKTAKRLICRKMQESLRFQCVTAVVIRNVIAGIE